MRVPIEVSGSVYCFDGVETNLVSGGTGGLGRDVTLKMELAYLNLGIGFTRVSE